MAAPVSEKGSSPLSNRTVAAGSLQAIHRVAAPPRLEDGRPLVFFMGAQYCPFCAGERWAFVKATSRFGTWTNLFPLQSKAGTDGFDSLPTYDLTSATYASSLISLHHKEIADRDGNPLQPLVGVEQDLVDTYDPSGGFPFTVITGTPGQYTIDLAYSPALLQGQSFEAVRAAVDSGADTPAARAVDDEADAITALLCKLTSGQPGSVCGSPTIQALTAQVR